MKPVPHDRRSRRMVLAVSMLLISALSTTAYAWIELIDTYDGVSVSGQCVTFARNWASAVLGSTIPSIGPYHSDQGAHWIYDDPNCYPSGTDRIANDGGNYPQHRDIIVWGNGFNGGIGHVAIVDSASSRDDVVVVDSNWLGGGVGYKHSITMSGYVLGWFRAPPPVTPANNLRWTGGPAGGRWYRQNLRLSYAVDGTDPLYCRERAGTHDATYQTRSGYFDMGYGGLGWKAFRVDAWNNCGSQAIDHPMGWDDQSPNVYWASDCPPRQVWVTGPQRASFRWNDALSGVKGDVETTYCRWNGGEKLAKYDGYVDIPEGKNTLEVRCEDDSWWDDGNHSGNAATIYGEFWIDSVPPVITVTFNPSIPDGENGWYTSDPTISLSAVDPNGSDGSGVNGKFYTLDGGPETPFTLPVLVSGDGIHTYSMRATDVAGNSGTTGDQIVKVDTTPPVPDSVYTDAESGSLDTLVATWSCSDPDSGITEYEYWIGTTPGADDVSPATGTVNNWAYAVNLNLIPNQDYYFTVRAKNAAGLWSGAMTSNPIRVIPGDRDAGPNFNSGGVSVPQEARASTNYRMMDSIGQFVVASSESSNFLIGHGYWHADTVFPLAATLGLAKKEANATTLQVGSAEKPVIVTSGTSTFAGRFYVQQPDKSSGIAVQYGVVGGPTLVEGDRVWLIGKLDTVNGERVLRFASPTKVDHANPLMPLYMGAPLLGGASFNEWTPGVLNGFGLNNVGLLVKTYGGLVSYRDPQGRFFYLDNGDDLYDGSHYGVRVICDGFTGGAKLAMPAYGKQVIVTGISSTVTINSQNVRAIRPRRQSDIQILGF